MANLVITIARSYGSGGRTLGKLLAKELGIKYYDRELLRLASDKSGINEELFGESDETVKNSILPKVIKKVGKGELISEEHLFEFQADVIKELAKEEDCVIIGRCADYVLKEYDNVISIYCYAPLKDCIEREKELSGLSEKEIVKKVERIDQKRAEYYKYHTNKEWNDASNYDLCLNTASLSYENLLHVVKAYIEVYKNK
ncbi:MAG: AAA family ATPase [Lachnospiraceae bacterium]